MLTHNRLRALCRIEQLFNAIERGCDGRESNPGQLLGRQLCSPLYHHRDVVITLRESAKGAFHCLWEETVLQSVCPGSDRSASLARGQGGEQVVSGVSWLLNNGAGLLLEPAGVNVSERG